MIPATQPYEARYKHEQADPNGKVRTYFSTKPVVAWDDDGMALVADKDTGRLRDANTWPNFAGVIPGQAPVVAVLPGAGWQAEYRDGDMVHRWPVLGWIVRSDGSCEAVDVDADGVQSDPTDIGNFTGYVRPLEEDDLE